MSAAVSHTHTHTHPKEHVCWGGGCEHTPHHRLEVVDLSVQYQEVRALEKIQFATECGRSMALIGPNGAGKSTLLKSLAGIIRGDQGKILWRGKPLTRSSHEIAYLPQRGDVDWNFPITVRGLVEMGRYPNLGWWRQYSKHDAEIVERALVSMNLCDLQDRQISALSGGQQQRAFIARALAQEAHVLLLDEPFTGLDKPAQENLSRLFKELTAEGRLLIASHHDLQTVTNIFDDVLLIRRHQVVFGPVAEAFTPEHVAAAYDTLEPAGRAAPYEKTEPSHCNAEVKRPQRPEFESGTGDDGHGNSDEINQAVAPREIGRMQRFFNR